MRSSPQVRLALAMSAINCRRLAGMRGRPGLDFHRQNNRNAFRCQRIRVSSMKISASFETMPTARSGEIDVPMARPGSGPESPWGQAVNGSGGWLGNVRRNKHAMHKRGEQGGCSTEVDGMAERAK